MGQKLPFLFIFWVILVATSTIVGAETEQRPLTKNNIGELFSEGDLSAGKVFLRQLTDLQQIESTGVVVETREPDYVVILGDRQRLNKLRSMGFSIEDPAEADHRLRLFRIWIRNNDELLRLRAIATDVWPDRWPADAKFPLYVKGRAYDSEFKWAKEAGLNMERCRNDNCD